MEADLPSYGDQLVAVLSAATEALRGLGGRVYRLTGAELDQLLAVVDGLAAQAGAGRFTLTAEAVHRGQVGASQAGSTQQWVADRCPSLDARDAALVAKAVHELADPGSADPALADPALADPALAGVREAVVQGRLSVPAGCVVAAELGQLTPLVEPGAREAVAAGLVAMGQLDGARGVRAVRPALLARYGLGEQLQQIEDRHRGLTELSCGHDIGGGITEYRMRLNPEARAVLEAALNVLAKPVPEPDAPRQARQAQESRAGRDPRTMPQRRGDALVEVCRRAVTLGSTLDPGGVKATLLVTISLDDLRHRTRPAVLVGGLDFGTVLGPETVRKLACDAALIPAVLNTDGQLLDLGRTRRLFSPAQLRALWLRDRHCTFPHCHTPATWTDAHHLRHWADGGATNLDNAALLCGRHHTIVHRDRLTATITTTPTGIRVIWDQTPGSYNRTLDQTPDPTPDQTPDTNLDPAGDERHGRTDTTNEAGPDPPPRR